MAIYKVVGLEQRPYEFGNKKGICTKLHLLCTSDYCSGLVTKYVKCSKDFDFSSVSIGSYVNLYFDEYSRVSCITEAEPDPSVISQFENVLIS